MTTGFSVSEARLAQRVRERQRAEGRAHCCSARRHCARLPRAGPPPPRPPRSAGSPPLLSWAFTIEREAAISPAGGVGREGRREVVDGAALGAHAGQQEDRVRHQLAQAARAGRAGSRRSPRRRATARTRPRRRAPSSSTIRASRSCSGAPSGSRSWRSAAPGLEVRTSTKQPAPAAAAASTSGSSASRPSSGLAVKASAPRPGDRAERRRRRADERLRVGRGGDRHVAALAVGDHEQAGVARRVARRRSSAAQPGRAEALEARELRLDRDAGRAGRLDRRDAVARRRRRPCASAGSPAAAAASSADGPELGRVGVEPEHDLAAALLYERREPVGEAVARVTRAWRRDSALDGVLSAEPAREPRHLAGRDLDPLAGLRVHALTRAAIGDGELAEAGEADLSAAAEGLLDDRQDRVDGLAGLLLAEAGLVGDLVDELCFVTFLLVFRFGTGRKLTMATDDAYQTPPGGRPFP